MGRFTDIIGVVGGKLKLGLTGPQLKGNGTAVEARNAADSAYATINALLHATYGDDFELNSGAAGAGADWKYTLRRPSTGMTHALTVVYPSADPTVGQALTVASFTANVITLGWTTVAAGTDKSVVDTTSLAFGTTSPLAMFSSPSGAVLRKISVVIDTPFNGTPSLSIGITGTVSKYLGATQVDLTAAAGTVFEIDPGLPSTAGEALIATYAASGATVGAARILTEYVIPS